MTAFADYQANQATALTPDESLIVHFWGYKNPGLKPRDILIWLIGKIVKSGDSDLTLPINEPDLVLIDVLEQLILSLLRKYRILLVLDGLGYFESESSSEEDELESDKKPKGGTKSKTGTKSKPSKKTKASKTVEASKNTNAKATKTSQELNEISELNANQNSEAETANDLLEKLVKILICIAKRNLGPGYYPLKLLFINPIRSETMTAAEEADKSIPVHEVPTAKEFEESPAGFMLPGGLKILR